MDIAKSTDRYEPPGGYFIWMLVILELLTFGVALLAYAYSSGHEAEAYQKSRALLDPRFGIANTVFLLTSGYCMAAAVRSFRDASLVQSRRFLLAAMLGGGLFLVAKGFEYAIKIEHGHTLGSTPFFTWYWLLTVFHLMHVVVGLVILACMTKKLGHIRLEDLEAGGVFWHMCDLVWLLLFPALYLMNPSV